MTASIKKEDFIKMYQEQTIGQMMETLGVKHNQIMKYVKKFGLSKPKGRPPKGNILILEEKQS